MIEVRRKRHENELHEKYMQLYHNEQCYEELMQSLEEAYQNRPAELRRLDNKREKRTELVSKQKYAWDNDVSEAICRRIKRCDRAFWIICLSRRSPIFI